MAKGDPLLTPWVAEFLDSASRLLSITVNFDNTTRALTSAVLHRDTGCRWTRIALDNPNDAVKVKYIVAPVDGAGDRTYTAAQMASQGLNTIEDVLAVQITAVQ